MVVTENINICKIKGFREVFKLFLSTLLITIIFSSNLFAYSKYDLWISSQSYTQVRKNTINENEWPLLEYLAAGASYGDLLDFDFNLKVMGDPLNERSMFDLYSTRIRLKNLGNILTITAGRQTLINSFSYDLIDGLDIVLKPDFYLGVEAYAGFIRFIELDEFRDYSFAGGAKIFLNNIRNTNAALEFRYERLENGGDWAELGFLGGRTFPVEFRPKLYAGVNFNLTNKILDQLTLGFSILPIENLDFSIEASRYDFKANYFDPLEDIFSLFSTGPLWEFKEAIGVFITKDITLFQSYSYLRYDYDLSTSNTGHLVKVGFEIKELLKRIRFMSNFFLNNSYGGRSYGVKGKANVKIWRALFGGLSVGFLNFNKVTGEQGDVSSVNADIGYEIVKGLKVILGAEYNSNDDFEREFRGNLAIKYDLF